MPCSSAVAASAFLRQALSDSPRCAVRADVSADLSTPGGAAVAINCMSLWHAGALTLRGATVNGTGTSEAVDGPLVHLPRGGVFTARIHRVGEWGGAHTYSDGGGGPGAGSTPDAMAAGGTGGAMHGVEDVLLLPDELFRDLLEQLRGQWRGWERAGGSSAWGDKCAGAQGGGAGVGAAVRGGGRGCCGWWSRPPAVATSELWQTQVVEAMDTAGIVLTGPQLKRWRAVGLPGSGRLQSCDGADVVGIGRVAGGLGGCAGGG